MADAGGCTFDVLTVAGLPPAVLARLAPAGRAVRYTLPAGAREAFADLLARIAQEIAFPCALAGDVALALAVQVAALVAREGTAGAGPTWNADEIGRAHVERALAVLGESRTAPMRVGALAVRLGLSPAHLRRLFRRLWDGKSSRVL
jgi:transcriptional regulator GlxA family with amidase domain